MGPTQQTFSLFVIKLFVFIITHNMNEDEGGEKGARLRCRLCRRVVTETVLKIDRPSGPEGSEV